MKPAKHFYSAAVSHPELQGAFFGTFGIPDRSPEWVMDGNQRRIFTSHEQAELAGYRILVSKLNRAHDPQSFMTRQTEKRQIRSFNDSDQRKEHSSEIDRVFGGSKK